MIASIQSSETATPDPAAVSEDLPPQSELNFSSRILELTRSRAKTIEGERSAEGVEQNPRYSIMD